MTAVSYGDEFFRGVAGLDSLRILLNEVLATLVRGDAERPPPTHDRTSVRQNDASSRHAPPGPKAVGTMGGRIYGRPAAGSALPAQSSPEAVLEAPTTVLPIIPETKAGPSGDGPAQFPEPPEPPERPERPDRPDRTDPAHEVWMLVERAQGGDTAAFGLIYDRYVDTVFRFIYFRVGNRPLAEDLTSDTFLRALKRIGSFTWQGRDLGAWLVTIARNLVADHFKSGRYRLEVTTGDVLDADREDRGPEGSPETAVVDHITNVALLTAVKQLNPEQQECIVLRFLQGFSVAETAQAMGKNEGAIKALQYRAVRALARLLPEGFQP
jgi:RNA polymerase sigma-70 factor (ECF subfamily)